MSLVIAALLEDVLAVDEMFENDSMQQSTSKLTDEDTFTAMAMASSPPTLRTTTSTDPYRFYPPEVVEAIRAVFLPDFEGIERSANQHLSNLFDTTPPRPPTKPISMSPEKILMMSQRTPRRPVEPSPNTVRSPFGVVSFSNNDESVISRYHSWKSTAAATSPKLERIHSNLNLLDAQLVRKISDMESEHNRKVTEHAKRFERIFRLSREEKSTNFATFFVLARFTLALHRNLRRHLTFKKLRRAVRKLAAMRGNGPA
eukprot:PhF_6_TR18944/c0_g2_i2/m.27759